MMEPFSRAELQRIRSRAVEIAETELLGLVWLRAYIDLADAADHLDAMIARSKTSADPVDHPVAVNPELTPKELNDRMVAEAESTIIYEGHAYSRPIDRGITLLPNDVWDEDARDIEHLLPEGHYRLRFRATPASPPPSPTDKVGPKPSETPPDPAVLWKQAVDALRALTDQRGHIFHGEHGVAGAVESCTGECDDVRAAINTYDRTHDHTVTVAPLGKDESTFAGCPGCGIEYPPNPDEFLPPPPGPGQKSDPNEDSGTGTRTCENSGCRVKVYNAIVRGEAP